MNYQEKDFIICYLDTNLIPRPDGIENPNTHLKFLLKKLFKLQDEGEITIRTAQGSRDDFLGSNNEKENSQALERLKTMQMSTEPIAELFLESNEDFTDSDIELFKIRFPERSKNLSRENIYESILNLSSNDKNDFRIIKSIIHDAHSYAFFFTNDKGFIKDGKKERLQEYVREKKRIHLEISELNEDMIKEVEKSIQEVHLLFNEGW